MIYYPLATSSWDDKERAAITRVVESDRFSMGPEVRHFEEAFAKFFGTKYAVMVNSGSSANLLAIAATIYGMPDKIQPGDEVIVPAVSWSTTYFPLQQYGLKLRFVDVDSATMNIDLNLLEEALTPATKMIMAVNLLGNPLDLNRLRAFAASHDLILIEDNAESMGAKVGSAMAGTVGHAGTFSCFFSHHISTMEGGVIVTDRDDLYHAMLSLRAHGWVRDQPAGSRFALDNTDKFLEMFRFVLPGYNLRPLEMSGAIGVEQLQKLPGLVAGRRQNGLAYQELFADHPDVRIQQETGESSWFGFAFVLSGRLAGRRAEVVNALESSGIECRPIVAGNFLRNPAIKYMQYSVYKTCPEADRIDEQGFFTGNHHFDIRPQLEKVHDILDRLSG